MHYLACLAHEKDREGRVIDSYTVGVVVIHSDEDNGHCRFDQLL